MISVFIMMYLPAGKVSLDGELIIPRKAEGIVIFHMEAAAAGSVATGWWRLASRKISNTLFDC
jgi:hypothetical protein